MIDCKLALTDTNCDGTSPAITGPDFARLELTNMSAASIDISSRFGPAVGGLELHVKGPGDEAFSTYKLRAFHTVEFMDPAPYLVKPQERYQRNLFLLAYVPKEKRIAGKFTVKMSYDHNGIKYVSNDVQLSLDDSKY